VVHISLSEKHSEVALCRRFIDAVHKLCGSTIVKE